MSVIKNPQDWDMDDCIEDCRYASRFCHENADGTLTCPEGWRECADDCRRHYASD